VLTSGGKDKMWHLYKKNGVYKEENFKKAVYFQRHHNFLSEKPAGVTFRNLLLELYNRESEDKFTNINNIDAQ
jgi:hypothetical protein